MCIFLVSVDLVSRLSLVLFFGNNFLLILILIQFFTYVQLRYHLVKVKVVTLQTYRTVTFKIAFINFLHR